MGWWCLESGRVQDAALWVLISTFYGLIRSVEVQLDLRRVRRKVAEQPPVLSLLRKL